MASNKVKTKRVKKKIKPEKENVYGSNNEGEDYEPPKTFKLLGYCPSCDMFLSENDFISKMIFECPCGCRKHKKHLRTESKRDKKRKAVSKKQYLRDTIDKNRSSEEYYKQNNDVNELPDVSIMGDVQE